MVQKIVCRNGTCRDISIRKSGIQRNDVIGSIEKDLLKDELGDYYEYDPDEYW